MTTSRAEWRDNGSMVARMAAPQQAFFASAQVVDARPRTCPWIGVSVKVHETVLISR
jgi:hypothetical protein